MCARVCVWGDKKWTLGHTHALSIMCSRLGCWAGHKVNAANGLSVNGVIKTGLQEDKSNVYNVHRVRWKWDHLYTCTATVIVLCICSNLMLL